jgi:hypothetical protein
VHSLNLIGCDNVSDVSALGYVHTLTLVLCRNVSDVSALGHVPVSFSWLGSFLILVLVSFPILFRNYIF